MVVLIYCHVVNLADLNNFKAPAKTEEITTKGSMLITTNITYKYLSSPVTKFTLSIPKKNQTLHVSIAKHKISSLIKKELSNMHQVTLPGAPVAPIDPGVPLVPSTP